MRKTGNRQAVGGWELHPHPTVAGSMTFVKASIVLEATGFRDIT